MVLSEERRVDSEVHPEVPFEAASDCQFIQV